MRAHSTNDAETLALSALAATLTDERRAQRFLALSGIDTDDLRRRASERSLLAALLRFLEAHEPDLIDVAEAIGVKARDLVVAREELET
jgi:Protein of unknown function (DUF3572)